MNRRVTTTLICIVFLIIGYIAGREHMRYEFQKSRLSPTKDSSASPAPPVIVGERAEKKVFEIEMIDVVKGVVKGKFWGALSGKYQLPAVSFSLKNHGSDLNGFFIYFKFDDLDGNRQLAVSCTSRIHRSIAFRMDFPKEDPISPLSVYR